MACVMALAATVQADPRRDVLALRVDGQPAGDVLAIVDGDHIALERHVLCRHGICLADDWVPLTQISDRIRYTFDATAGELVLETILDKRETTVIDLQPGMPPGIERGGATSLYVNYALTAEQNQPSSGFAEAGLSFGGHALAYSTVIANDTDVVRGMSYVSTELRGSMLRIDAGDNVVTGGVLGGGGFIGGLHVHRDFGMDPYYISRPTLSHSGVVTSPSTVEVYRDGVLMTRTPVAPGPYRVEDIVGATSSDAKVVVRDAFGSTSTTMLAPAPNALRPGLSQFDYSVGYVRKNLATKSFDYVMPGFLAVHRYGLSNRVTLGARAEGASDRASGGASLLASAGAFVVDANVGVSTGTDVAAALQLGWHHRALTMNFLGRLVGQRYETLDLDLEDDRALASGTLAASWSMTSSTTLTAQVTAEHKRDAGNQASASAGAFIQLSPALTLSLSASANKNRELPLAFDGMALLSVALGARTNGSLSATASGTTEATISRSTPRVGGIGVQAQASAGDRTSASSRITAVTDHGRLEVAGDWRPGMRNTTATASGGIVISGDTLAATRTVQSGYAIVKTATPNTRIYVDNQLVGSTNEHGVLVVPELQANYANRVRVDVRDLPFALSVPKIERLVAPPTLGGIVVNFIASSRAFVHGRFVGPIDTSYGNVRIGDTIAPIGHGGVFELEDVPAGLHELVVDVEGIQCKAKVLVPTNRRDVAAGDLKCVR